MQATISRHPAMREPVDVDLALQGGGSHGAFTWGVLDRLLEEPWLRFIGISGTSAGAMNAAVMVAYDHLYDPYTPSDGYLARGQASGLDPFGLLGSEYAPIEKPSVLGGLIDTFSVVYPQIQDLDLRRDAPRLEVPVFVLDGAAELDGRRDLALEWFARLEAPGKRLVTYEGAAHAVAFEQADAVEQLLVREVLPLAGPR